MHWDIWSYLWTFLGSHKQGRACHWYSVDRDQAVKQPTMQRTAPCDKEYPAQKGSGAALEKSCSK